jgi:hypothetical protein
MDEIPTGEEVLVGTFFLNECPIIILFDSGASCDFVSSTCTKRAKLTLVVLGAPYVISTTGGRVDTDHIALKVPLELFGRTWRHYLLGNVVHIYTDHKSLKYIFTQPDLNMRQRRWLELIKDYQQEVHYHLGKANVVVNVLSRKAHYNYLPAMCSTREESSTRVLPDLSLFNITLTPTLRNEIIAAQKKNEGMGHIKRRMREGDPKVACFHKDVEGTLWFKDRLVVPKKEALKKKILDEAHTLRYSIHPGNTKMYHDLRQQFWWMRMKHETALYVSECDTCRKVKVD